MLTRKLRSEVLVDFILVKEVRTSVNLHEYLFILFKLHLCIG
uniref:Uncharacterized protein n=1 Tax=Heterorhabditis bacteriophora TaxID=37862 RepID=A0A1I7WB98_HETBA